MDIRIIFICLILRQGKFKSVKKAKFRHELKIFFRIGARVCRLFTIKQRCWYSKGYPSTLRWCRANRVWFHQLERVHWSQPFPDLSRKELRELLHPEIKYKVVVYNVSIMVKKRVWIVSIGKWTARTCSPISVDDCQTANKIQYCYCKTDRCNSPITNENQTTTTTISTTTIEPVADISNGAGKQSFFYIWLTICLLFLVWK